MQPKQDFNKDHNGYNNPNNPNNPNGKFMDKNNNNNNDLGYTLCRFYHLNNCNKG